jgi:hypothetical protein
VAEAPAPAPAEEALPIPPTPIQQLTADAGALPRVMTASVEIGEVVIHTDRDSLLGVLETLRDDPRFAFEQLMDICGVDWPQRPERFDVVYNLLSVSLNHRIRVIVTTDETSATCSASPSRGKPICVVSSPITVSSGIRCARIFPSPAMSSCVTTRSAARSSTSR